MREDLVRLSKTISHALRHKPEQYGLTLDNEGWVPVQELLEALGRRRSQWVSLTEADLREMMAQSEKQRFEIQDGKIRAFYGHSIPERVEREPSVPPVVLYHGTTPKAAALIRQEGLKPMRRQYVHLSAEKEAALQVARRRTNHPVILKVAAREAYRQGIRFYLGNEMVWLAEPIPARFIIQE
ncbi:MAG TPA: RNA 2'-phosphotransferase [Ktedonobacteraceae bacterium]|jgi:putative RNA 2'-phosphotransferase|nr:RNA 2'-phosphotransferase [Ktedonobacteraceae bacterium]